jgi:glycerophosphoryl diester phosphodiesterase
VAPTSALMRNLPLLLGHRGARGRNAPAENTFAAYDLALASGCDGFEFDVRLTLDGQAVVCHDPRSEGLEVSRSKLSDLGDLCTLESVLTRYTSRAFLNIELKVSGLNSRVLNGLLATAPQKGCLVSSFLPQVLDDLHFVEPEMPLGIICENEGQLAMCRDLQVGWVVPHYRLAIPALIKRVHNEGKKVVVWTVNRSAEMLRFVQLGVDGIISDDPRLLVNTVRNLGA